MLQSLPGSLLYISKCVKSSQTFLNRMLDLLRSSDKQANIKITPELAKDLAWFLKFIPLLMEPHICNIPMFKEKSN